MSFDVTSISFNLTDSEKAANTAKHYKLIQSLLSEYERGKSFLKSSIKEENFKYIHVNRKESSDDAFVRGWAAGISLLFDVIGTHPNPFPVIRELRKEHGMVDSE